MLECLRISSFLAPTSVENYSMLEVPTCWAPCHTDIMDIGMDLCKSIRHRLLGKFGYDFLNL